VGPRRSGCPRGACRATVRLIEDGSASGEAHGADGGSRSVTGRSRWCCRRRWSTMRRVTVRRLIRGIASANMAHPRPRGPAH
jgi:hypothetical protein